MTGPAHKDKHEWPCFYCNQFARGQTYTVHESTDHAFPEPSLCRGAPCRLFCFAMLAGSSAVCISFSPQLEQASTKRPPVGVTIASWYYAPTLRIVVVAALPARYAWLIVTKRCEGSRHKLYSPISTPLTPKAHFFGVEISLGGQGGRNEPTRL